MPTAATRIWLARHAETATPHVFHGAESDVGLSELGLAQAAAAAGWFREFAPTAVVSSGMLRAILTAAPIAAACGIIPTRERELYERRVGPLSGTRHDTPDGPWARTLVEWGRGNTAHTSHEAESYDALRDRVLPAFLRVAAAHPGGRVVVVAHGIVCKVLLLSLLPGWGPVRWSELGRVPNLATSELVFEAGEWRAERLLEVPPPVVAANAAGGVTH